MRISEELSYIYSDDQYRKMIERLYCCEKNQSLPQEDYEFLLSCAMLFMQEYDRCHDSCYFELAYNIILRYSVQTQNYLPLYDFSCNYGFYPTVRFINRQHLLSSVSVENALLDYHLESYKNDNYVETFEQHKTRRNVVNSKASNVSFIAPTSSGKSSVIIQHYKNNPQIHKAIILVPTKALIAQTYSELRKSDLNCKIISHESMFKNEETFVGALTQERALRLLENNPELKVDCVYVDEAHNIFTNDPRNVLLSRVIKVCKLRNESVRILYLSPFVCESKHLLQGEEAEIDEQRIEFNVKEPDIREYRRDGSVYTFDRFANKFHKIGVYADPFEYMFANTQNKNFCFLGSPKKIEEFAKTLYMKTRPIEITAEIHELMEMLGDFVHPDFYMINYLTHGIVYLHAKLPDQVKDYLEYQYRNNKDLKYLVANSVIMEGINLPIDSLFVWDINNMDGPRLLNLMGRVNRLNNIYSDINGNIDKLLTPIYFVTSSFYRNDKREMTKTIQGLYDERIDLITNPLLPSCNIDNLSEKKKDKCRAINEEIVKNEILYYSQPNGEMEILRQRLIATGMNQLVSISTESVNRIYERLRTVNRSLSVVEIVSYVFAKSGVATDKAFSRLKNDSAVRYYKHFIKASHEGNLASLISSELHFHEKRREEGENLMYVGPKFGEEKGPYSEGGGNVFVNLRKKNQAQIVNYLIVKIKVEQEFLSFQYNRAVNFLHEFGVIDDETYNVELYGTNDEKKIQMLNLGIPIGVLSLLENYNQLSNITFDQNGNLKGTNELKAFMLRQNSYWKYELNKHIFF